ncbi:hypothetical protein GCM10011391_33800 [Pullulanibacillus camelliae]|uniref:GGDEF domain-containing protein n=1 Tax=Pullulanibacillus camelliae TaxID=1707096 RepID=A0A8J3DZT1_9BACL|nr:sensor domain-containing diguanylate cyclase [Pullulanibacillus camelliae]GGE52203.1 hypothetical protein GCM10011391_33800 [Pullulanibacillus camelliae]
MISKLNNTLPVLDFKDLLLELVLKTDYTENLNRTSQAIVDYFARVLNGMAFLFMRDMSRKHYYIEASSDTHLEEHLDKFTLNHSEVEALIHEPYFLSVNECPLFLNPLKTALLKKTSHYDEQYIVFLTYDKECIGCVLLMHQMPLTATLRNELLQLTEKCSKLLFRVKRHMEAAKLGKQYEKLFLVTDKFHSTMNEKEVLEEITHSLYHMYPSSIINLLFIDENRRETPHHYEASQVFLSGDVKQIQMDENRNILYVPLRGQQGIYGVLEVITTTRRFFSSDINLIKLLANTAGHALENARLYQQSQHLISDLKIINEASKHLNANSSFKEATDYLINHLTKAFKPEEIAIFYSYSDKHLQALPGSSNFFLSHKSYAFVDYIKARVEKTGDALFSFDLLQELTVKAAPYRSLMAIPIQQDNEIVGLVVLVHSAAYHFTFDGYKLASSLVQHSALALINARLREELEHMVITDQLTGLYSRHYLNTKIAESFEKGEGGGLILIDIDNFKEINDTYGHPVGDQILKQVALILMDNIRGEDIAARWGGEELTIYLPKSSLYVVEKIARRLLVRVEGDTHPKVTISCGIANWTKEEEQYSPEHLLEIADQALYMAKSLGKNRIYIADK